MYQHQKENSYLTPAAKSLRRPMTKEENKLWIFFLKKYPVHIYRQRVIGRFIADFYCARAKLVIEVDGSQHYEPQGLAYDAQRALYMEELGISTIRVSNRDVNFRFEEVCAYLDEEIKKRLDA